MLYLFRLTALADMAMYDVVLHSFRVANGRDTAIVTTGKLHIYWAGNLQIHVRSHLMAAYIHF